MQLHTLDGLIVLASVLLCLAPALFFTRRAGRNLAEFFASGQSAPWWLVGVSMVATTFSADTPNLVTDIVRSKGGVAGNWVWWAFVLTGMATVFFYARLWRRSGVLTDLEFYEIRYCGRAASAVRGFRAVYLGLFFNCVIMATVNLAAAKIAAVVLGWPREQTLLVCGVINVVFAATAGLWGVLVIDLLQFGMAMTASVALAWFALQQPEVGGLSGLATQLGARTPEVLSLLPDFSNHEVALTIFFIPLAVQWWAVWYPGAEPGGGSYIAQRMLASRSERDALAGTLLFNFAHYVLRPWPWILVALASLVVFPDLESIRRAFPQVDPALIGPDIAYPAMMRFLPPGWMGLMLAGLLAAYVSTMITHLNWGTSYLVHDFYRRFVRPNAPERHYVQVGRWTTAGLMVAAAGCTVFIETAREGFNLLLQVGAGTGLIYLLRWFWWRINAWTEIVAMIVSFGVSAVLVLLKRAGYGLSEPWPLLVTVGVTTVAWLLATFLMAPTPRAQLLEFVRRVRPPGPGWRELRAAAGVTASEDSLPLALLGWVLGCAAVWSGLFCAGSFLLGHPGRGAVLLGVFAVCAFGLGRVVTRLWRGRGGADGA